MNAKENSRKSFDKQAATYDTGKYGAHSRRQYNYILKKISEYKISSLLDVGCGTGEMLRLISERFPKIELTGVDISLNMLDKAKSKIGNMANLILSDSEKLPFDDNSFELVMCNDSFHHYPSPLNVLSEFHRVLKPEGTLLISDYSIGFPIRQLMNLLIKYSHDGDVRIYSKKEYLKMLSECSFKGIDYKKINTTGCLITAKKVV